MNTATQRRWHLDGDRSAQPRIRGEHAGLARRLCAVPFLTFLPLLFLLSLLTREGWKVVIGLGIGLAVVVVIVVLCRRMPKHCNQRLRAALDEKLEGRENLTPEQFAQRYYPPELQSVAVTLRQLLDSCLGFEVSGLQPTDNFLELLRLEEPSSVAWMDDPLEAVFFEEAATAFGLNFRDVENREAFHSFDDLVKYVADTS